MNEASCGELSIPQLCAYQCSVGIESATCKAIISPSRSSIPLFTDALITLYKSAAGQRTWLSETHVAACFAWKQLHTLQNATPWMGYKKRQEVYNFQVRCRGHGRSYESYETSCQDDCVDCLWLEQVNTNGVHSHEITGDYAILFRLAISDGSIAIIPTYPRFLFGKLWHCSRAHAARPRLSTNNGMWLRWRPGNAYKCYNFTPNCRMMWSGQRLQYFRTITLPHWGY